jgi:isopenicillin N synthase-like dioxygenase
MHSGNTGASSAGEDGADIATEFFDLEPARKEEAAAKLHPTRGYTALGALGLSYAMDKEDLTQARSAPSDLFERYRIGPVDAFGEALMTRYSQTAYAPNVWPADVPSFQPAMMAYYKTMNQLSGDLLKLFALALKLPENWFESKVNHSMASLAINHYPAQNTLPHPGQLRAGPHTDYGTLTVVAPTSAPGGLEIRTKDGQWQAVDVEPGTFVVNIGDMMAQWTNDRWVSTVHRVANPPPKEASNSRRLSMVFFHQPNPDAVIECIPTCCDGEHPARYAAVNAGDYISQKISRHFKSYLAG